MKDRDKLKKLVQIIGDLLKLEGNEWLIDEILKIISETSSVEEIAKHPLIDDIYEHCIKKIIDKQAQDFYKSFPIKNDELIKNLIYDFKEMEYNRRRDRFYEFSFCLNQQIEGITNYLFDNRYLKEWKNISEDIKNKIVEDYKVGEKNIKNTLQDLIIDKEKENENQWSDLSKFKLVYFLMNKSNNYKLPFDFKRVRDLRQEISIARNECHRGSDKYEWQKDILEKINGNESKYYFKFYGFLQDFIAQVESSYSSIGPNKKTEKSSQIRNRPSNTLGDNNPALEKLKQQMDKNK